MRTTYPNLKRGAIVSASALLIIGAGAGCDDGFSPPSYLNSLRVLAIVASPPEVGLGERARLTPHIYALQGDALRAAVWSFCPLTLGAAQGFACALQSCEVPLKPEDDGSVLVDPAALAAGCAAQLVQSPGQPPGAAPSTKAALPERVESAVRLSVSTVSGERRDAVARLEVWTGGLPQGARNRAPVIQGVELDDAKAVTGQAAAEAAAEGDERIVRVRIAPASVDRFTDESGRQRTEEMIISFFATAGRFEYDREAGLDVTGRWRAEQLEPGQTEAQIYVVARDLRGGQAVAGPFVIPIKR
jgi:hypothetical protein